MATPILDPQPPKELYEQAARSVVSLMFPDKFLSEAIGMIEELKNGQLVTTVVDETWEAARKQERERL